MPEIKETGINIPVTSKTGIILPEIKEKGITFTHTTGIILSETKEKGIPVTNKPGIILPDGTFLENSGDGHEKNARRFCEKYIDLMEQLNASNEKADDFMIIAGCAIIASYIGVRYLKIAKNNEQQNMKDLIREYEEQGYTIWKYWVINPEYAETLNDALKKSQK